MGHSSLSGVHLLCILVSVPWRPGSVCSLDFDAYFFSGSFDENVRICDVDVPGKVANRMCTPHSPPPPYPQPPYAFPQLPHPKHAALFLTVSRLGGLVTRQASSTVFPNGNGRTGPNSRRVHSDLPCCCATPRCRARCPFLRSTQIPCLCLHYAGDPVPAASSRPSRVLEPPNAASPLARCRHRSA